LIPFKPNVQNDHGNIQHKWPFRRNARGKFFVLSGHNFAPRMREGRGATILLQANSGDRGIKVKKKEE
jgi:hypothetical protein